MPTYSSRSQFPINPSYPGVITNQVRVIDPSTGKDMPYVFWADTEWGMLKRGVPRTDNSPGGPVKMQLEKIAGYPRLQIKTEYVQKDFDLIYRPNGRTLHRIRVVNGNARDLGPTL